MGKGQGRSIGKGRWAGQCEGRKGRAVEKEGGRGSGKGKALA